MTIFPTNLASNKYKGYKRWELWRKKGVSRMTVATKEKQRTINITSEIHQLMKYVEEHEQKLVELAIEITQVGTDIPRMDKVNKIHDLALNLKVQDEWLAEYISKIDYLDHIYRVQERELKQ